MTVAAVSASAAWWATSLAVVADVAMIAGTAYSAYAEHEQGKAQEQQYKAQAAEQQYQAQLEMERAGIAQVQGEQAAEARSRLLAAEIGSNYAAWAGNGLLVDGAGGLDTFGSVLTSSVAEAQTDISTIQDNAAINVWTHQANASSLIAGAKNNLVAGKNARTVAGYNALGTSLSGAGTLIGAGFASYGSFKAM